jgi:PAS domain S-box-containing protein
MNRHSFATTFACCAAEQWLTRPVTDAEHARRRRLLDHLLVGMSIVACAALVATRVAGTRWAFVPVVRRTALALLLGAGAPYALNRLCPPALPATLFLLFLTAVAAVTVQDAAGLAIPILLAGMLLRSWAGLVLAALGILLRIACSPGFPGQGIEVPSLLALATAALLSWLATHNPTQALRDLRQCGRDLATSEERFRQLAESIPDGLAIVEQGRVVYANERLCAITGHTREELAAMDSLDLAAPEERNRLRQAMAQARQAGTLPAGLAFWIVRQDGVRRHVRSHYTARPGADGRQDHCLISTDVTEQLRVDERLCQTQKMEAMGRLAAGVAHDLSNYLTVIGSYADLLLNELEAGDPGQEMASHIQQAVDQARSLTGQLLAFSRQQTPPPRVLHINEAIAGVKDILRRLAGKEVDLVVECDPEAACVRAGPGQVEQILLNLVTNACDAISGQGTITIRVANEDVDRTHKGDVEPGAYVMVAVSDTGAGIEAGILPRIFEPFFTTKEAGRGTGLGLSIVDRIVRQSGGHVTVESRPGQGTTFRVYLPRVATE